MPRFVQIASAVVPQVDGVHADEHLLHALDEDGRVWVYVDDRIERDEAGKPVYGADNRAKLLPPRWEPLSAEKAP
jgi:hypothetical protein